MDWDDEVDLLVCGSGAAGLTAAFVAANEGLDVLLCEKSAQLGGTTATSAGTLWVPGSPPIQRSGQDASVAVARTYLEEELGTFLRSDLLEAFLGTGPEAIAYLERHGELRFRHVENPDYHSDRPGGSAFGRAIGPLPVDGRLLGADFGLIRPPRSIHMILGGMMVERREIPMLLSPLSSIATLRHVLGVVARHAWSRLRYPRGTRLLLGNALVARFLLSLRRTTARIRVNAALTDLFREGGTVTGAVVTMDGGARHVRARCGVILATGGFPHSAELRAELMPGYPHEHSFAFEGNTGDGMVAARKVGAIADIIVSNPGFWSPVSVLNRPDGTQVKWIHGHLDRGKPGLIAVSATGRRFVNEADSYHDFVMAQFALGRPPTGTVAHLICDHKFIREYGLGLIRPKYARLGRYLAAGYLKRADSIGGLAREIGVDAPSLETTVGRHNADALKGIDTEFGRGSTAFNRFNGDRRNALNPCMAPIVKPPFYAVTVSPCTIGLTLGLKTDADGCVLDRDGSRILGLYACGNDMSSVMRGFYPGPGATLGPGVVFAYRAAMNAARRREPQSASTVIARAAGGYR